MIPSQRLCILYGTLRRYINTVLLLLTPAFVLCQVILFAVTEAHLLITQSANIICTVKQVHNFVVAKCNNSLLKLTRVSPTLNWTDVYYSLAVKRLNISIQHRIRTWADAERDGRPAEYRWRPLFNTAKFGWRPLLEYRAVTLPRRESRW